MPQESADDRFKWIAASEFTEPFGLLDVSLLPPQITHAHKEIETLFHDSLRAFNEGGDPLPCYPITMTPGQRSRNHPGFPKSIEDIAANAAAIVKGVVVATEGGFAHGKPGLMLEVRAEEWLLETQSYSPRDSIFVFYPAGEFSIGHARICAATNGMPPAPSVGDAVLLFPYRFALDSAAGFLVYDQYGAYRADGKVRASRAVIGVRELVPGASWRALEDAMRAAAERRARR